MARTFSSKSRPFYFRNGQKADTIDDLLRLCEEYREDAAYHLTHTHFEPWLKDRGRVDLARIASNSRSLTSSDDDRLTLFIGFAKVVNYLQEARSKRFTFLLTGRTGVGKSSTINTLLGKEVAKEGDGKPVTASVEPYEAEIERISCLIVDTPGLCDGSKMEPSYAEQMQNAIRGSGIDCLWFVTSLADERVREDELKALRIVTTAFGREIWNRGVIVLTFADRIPANEYPTKCETRINTIREALAETRDETLGKTVGEDIAQNVPFVVVTNRRDRTPDGHRWLGRLYIATLNRMPAEEGFGPFFLATSRRVVIEDEPEPVIRSPYRPFPTTAIVPHSSHKKSPPEVIHIKEVIYTEKVIPGPIIYVPSTSVEKSFGEILGDSVVKCAEVGAKVAGVPGLVGGAIVGMAAGAIRVAGEAVRRGIDKVFSWFS